jgi:type IV pilus assembly protein PilM
VGDHYPDDFLRVRRTEEAIHLAQGRTGRHDIVEEDDVLSSDQFRAADGKCPPDVSDTFGTVFRLRLTLSASGFPHDVRVQSGGTVAINEFERFGNERGLIESSGALFRARDRDGNKEWVSKTGERVLFAELLKDRVIEHLCELHGDRSVAAILEHVEEFADEAVPIREETEHTHFRFDRVVTPLTAHSLCKLCGIKRKCDELGACPGEEEIEEFLEKSPNCEHSFSIAPWYTGRAVGIPMGFLDKIKQSGFFGQLSNSALGIDIGASSIKIVQLRKQRGGALLETYGELALGPYAKLTIGQATSLPLPQVVSALTDLMKEANATTRFCGISIPFSSSLITLIDMPSLDEKQLASMIPLEARKYIPVPISEVTLDWFILPETDTALEGPQDAEQPSGGELPSLGKKTEVLLVAIHNETLNNYREITDGSKLNASFFEIEIFSSIRAVLEQSLTPMMIFDMGAATTKLYIVEHGIIRASHIINRGSQDITRTLSQALSMSLEKAEELKRKEGLNCKESNPAAAEAMLLVLDQIFSETNRVVLSFEKRYNKNVSKIVLTGGGAVLKGMLPLAKEHLETEVELGDPFSKVETPAFLGDVLKEVGPEFAVAVGLALRRLQELE